MEGFEMSKNRVFGKRKKERPEPKDWRDIHFMSHRYENAKREVSADSSLSSKDKSHILNYAYDALANNNTEARALKRLYVVKNFAKRLGKPLEDATKDDVVRVVGELNSDTGLSEWTKQDYKSIARAFYKWLRGTENYPPEVAWITLKMKKLPRKKREDYITKEELLRMLEYCRNPMERAFLSFLYESGCRIGEVLGMKIKDVKFMDRYAEVDVFGKTGGRTIYTVFSCKMMKTWLNDHPLKTEQEAPFWYSVLKKRRVRYASIRKFLQTVADRAGVKKRANPHGFRHARATSIK